MATTIVFDSLKQKEAQEKIDSGRSNRSRIQPSRWEWEGNTRGPGIGGEETIEGKWEEKKQTERKKEEMVKRRKEKIVRKKKRRMGGERRQ